ncbi:MAG: P-type conjugative transfer protein TrbJ, partial [Alphaproteobacteria bacterium]
MRIPTRKYLIATALGAGTIGSLVALIVPIAPAQAQLTVFDPSNYSQNLLTAARTLQQVNNQIRSLQNQAQSLVNQAKNLTTIGFPEIQAITQTLQQIDQLMGQAQGIQFRVAGLDQEFRALFPQSFNQAMTM